MLGVSALKKADAVQMGELIEILIYLKQEPQWGSDHFHSHC